MKPIYHLTVLTLLVYNATISGQSIAGKVIGEAGIGLENIYIYNKTGKSHSHTNALGIFQLKDTAVGDSLSVSGLGFQTLMYTIVPTDFDQDIRIQLQDQPFLLDEIILQPDSNPSKSITAISLDLNPVNSSQELLREVPGLFIAQHAGGGKAEQLFLRGFDIDHGTDVAISVDGVPVNMVSHAHGQGYADLHFVIPETVANIDFEKGAYNAASGNFATAGYVNFNIKEKIDKSSVSTTIGQYNLSRSVGLFDILNNTKGQSAYLATEYIASDGPFESPQNFTRLNLMGNYVAYLPSEDKLMATVSHFTSRWDASGQIPQRAVRNGLISRFGAIDDTEGGETSRTNLNFIFTKSNSKEKISESQLFYSHYDFQLFSNFTFFLNDPVNGDQILQEESRDIFGVKQTFKNKINEIYDYSAGVGLRVDIIQNSVLANTLNRKTILDYQQFGDINEANGYAFGNFKATYGSFTLKPAVRLDYFKFDYRDQLSERYDPRSENSFIISPKFTALFSINKSVQLFTKFGTGFHSNDARSVSFASEVSLPRSYNADLGGLFKLTSNLILETSLWYLLLEDELIYVGDEGIVESGGRTRRLGIDSNLQYQPYSWLLANIAANYAYARSLEAPPGEDLIPLAPEFTMTAGIGIKELRNFSAGINSRFIADRAANEDGSITAKGYWVTDANINYQRNNWKVGIAVDNFLDVEWNEAQFATTSRLREEQNEVTELHFTPGVPFQLRGTVTYAF